MTDSLEGKTITVTVTEIGHPGQREGDVVKCRLVAGENDIIISIAPELALELGDGLRAAARQKNLSVNPKRPRDTNQLAKAIVDIATGETPAVAETSKVVRAKKGGAAGGPARAKALTPAQRSEIAHLAAQARWKKSN
jgi:hypothetical protein